MTITGMALRNVLRNPRRSTLNIIALTVGTSILFLALGWIGGYHRYIFDSLIDFETGHGKVLRDRYYDERQRLPVDILVERYDEMREMIDDVDGVIAATGRVRFPIRLSTGAVSFSAGATAVDQQYENAVGVLAEYVVEGDPPAPDSRRGVWIGRPVADKAAIAVGDTLFLRALDRHGVENLYDAPVAGVFEYGYPLLDEGMVYIDMDTAGELLDLDGGVSEIVYRLEPGIGVDEGRRRVENAVARAAVGEALEVRIWRDFAQAAVAAVEGDTSSFGVMTAVMYLLIVLGILNSMSMSVHERTREIGTIRAIGMTRRTLRRVFALESAWQATAAIVASAIISAPLALALARIGIDITGAMPADMPVPFGERFRAVFSVWHGVAAIASAYATALVGALIPIRRAGRITVAEAMRETA
jgi:putative ABC transport system permease protein